MTDLNNLLHAEPNARTENCDKHGAFEALNYIGNMWTRCPDCQAEERAAEAAAEEAKRRDLAALRWSAQMQQAGIPERFKDRTLDNFAVETPGQQKALRFAREYADGFDEMLRIGRCALLLGKPGTGKTHIAVAIGHHLMAQKRIVLYSTLVRAIRRVKDTWGHGSKETESQAIKSMVDPDLLILDEVGIQFGSATEQNILFDLVNERYERCKPTFFLSNLSLDDVTSYLGERIIDRVRENGGKCILFDGESYRRKAEAGRA